MGNFELASDFVINDTLQPHVNDNFRIVEHPGSALHDPARPGLATYPKILTTGSGNAVHRPFLFRKLIALTAKDKPNVVYIGTPFFDREDKYESGTESFRAIGCRVKRLMVAKECTTPSAEEMRRIIIDWADLIFISGGNSLFALLRWQSIGLDLLLKGAALGGKVLCGGSAGCGCYFDSMQTDSLKPEACKLSEKVLTELSAEARLNWSFIRITCLGFINAFCVPHIDTVGTNNVARVDIAKKMLLEAHVNTNYGLGGDSQQQQQQQPPRPVVGFGVDEKACIIYNEGKIKIWSDGKRATGMGEATCHILFVNNLNEVMCIPLPYNTGEALTMDEWIDRAMRSVMALQSPLDLHVGNAVSNASHRRGCSASIDFMSSGDENQVLSTVTQVLRKTGLHLSGIPPQSPLRRSQTVGVAVKPPQDTLKVGLQIMNGVVLPTHIPPPPPLPSPLSPLGLSRVRSTGSLRAHVRVRSQSMNSFVDMLQTLREIPG